ncbi:MAG: hypothetical protein AAF965_01055 [Pseudomonadota bacterium]
MTKQRSLSTPEATSGTQDSDRDARLKAALRANLARRKQQARQKQAITPHKPVENKPGSKEEN